MHPMMGTELSRARERELLAEAERDRHAKGIRAPRTRRPTPR
jgi:hypothetical protein